MRSSELDQILRLRLAIARLGESDLNAWWNSRYLGKTGQSILRMQFPRTLRLAQARSAILVARERCRQVVSREDCFTLWSLPSLIEEALETRLARLAHPTQEWSQFFETLVGWGSHSVKDAVVASGASTEAEVERARPAIPESTSSSFELAIAGPVDLSLVLSLALGFDAGRKGELIVPYRRDAQ